MGYIGFKRKQKIMLHSSVYSVQNGLGAPVLDRAAKMMTSSGGMESALKIGQAILTGDYGSILEAPVVRDFLSGYLPVIHIESNFTPPFEYDLKALLSSREEKLDPKAQAYKNLMMRVVNPRVTIEAKKIGRKEYAPAGKMGFNLDYRATLGVMVAGSILGAGLFWYSGFYAGKKVSLKKASRGV